MFKASQKITPASYQPRSDAAASALDGKMKQDIISALESRGISTSNGKPGNSAFLAYLLKLEPVSGGKHWREKKSLDNLGAGNCMALPQSDMPALHGLVSGLKDKSGMKKMPEICIHESTAPHAVSYMGPFGKTSIISVGTGMLMAYSNGKLSLGEVEAVMAHEISHISKYHTLKGYACHAALTFGPWIAAIGIAALAHVSFYLGAASLGIGAFVLAFKEQLFNKVRHSFEFSADKSAACLAGARNLIGYFNKLPKGPENFSVDKDGILCFSPKRGRLGEFLIQLEENHPPLYKRIARLEKIAQQQDSRPAGLIGKQ
ncbi:MAG: M48 family metallopeptidase [Candidatus Micrarchaeia archaeon]